MYIGLIGFGYWGEKLLRNLQAVAAVTELAVAEPAADRRAACAAAHPALRLTPSARHLFDDPRVDAVVIATPPGTHYDLAHAALQQGKHVFLEKPGTTSPTHLDRLRRLAHARGLTLLVDYTYLYTSAVQALPEALGAVGPLTRIESVRTNRADPRYAGFDVDVLWDLAVHDVAILSHLLQTPPEAVQALATQRLANGHAGTVALLLHFPGGLTAHVRCSWTAPEKVRQMTFRGAAGHLLFDDLARHKVTVHAAAAPAPHRPALAASEALRQALDDFVGAVRTGCAPLADASRGLTVTQVLAAAQTSMQAQGRSVSLRRAPAPASLLPGEA